MIISNISSFPQCVTFWQETTQDQILKEIAREQFITEKSGQSRSRLNQHDWLIVDLIFPCLHPRHTNRWVEMLCYRNVLVCT